jgi:hypothetical protein
MSEVDKIEALFQEQLDNVKRQVIGVILDGLRMTCEQIEAVITAYDHLNSAVTTALRKLLYPNSAGGMNE